MNLRKFAVLFLSTAAIGMGLGLVLALTGWFGEVPPAVALLTGGVMAATSLTGFWFYLTLNFMMRNVMSFQMWVSVQTLLTGLAFYYLSSFHHTALGGRDEDWLPAMLSAAWPLAVGFLVALFKARVSGMRSLLPSLFFMYAMTTIDWYMTSNSSLQMTQILIIILTCNAYILLMYTRLLKQPSLTRKQEREMGSNMNKKEPSPTR